MPIVLPTFTGKVQTTLPYLHKWTNETYYYVHFCRQMLAY